MPKTILTPEAIQTLESYETAFSGYYYKMIDFIQTYIQEGVKRGDFTRQQAEHDLEVALRISYACNNIDDYEHYYMSCQWLEEVEDLAQGCGMWYYRYACALMYCGQPEKALEYAEQGVREQPDYPWCWLLLAQLRSHFGNRQGALEANASGLALVPGDYEFTRQEADIRAGKSLTELLNHYILAEHDEKLLSGENSAEAAEKLDAIAGIVCDTENLAAIKAVIGPTEWEADSPYCTFTFPYQGGSLQGVFCMNEAALSKFDIGWVQETFANLPELSARDAKRLVQLQKIPRTATLAQVIIERNRDVHFTYDFNQDTWQRGQRQNPICR